jgi:hypothetical protein
MQMRYGAATIDEVDDADHRQLQERPFEPALMKRRPPRTEEAQQTTS